MKKFILNTIFKVLLFIPYVVIVSYVVDTYFVDIDSKNIGIIIMSYFTLLSSVGLFQLIRNYRLGKFIKPNRIYVFMSVVLTMGALLENMTIYKAEASTYGLDRMSKSSDNPTVFSSRSSLIFNLLFYIVSILSSTALGFIGFYYHNSLFTWIVFAYSALFIIFIIKSLRFGEVWKSGVHSARIDKSLNLTKSERNSRIAGLVIVAIIFSLVFIFPMVLVLIDIYLK